VVIPLAYRATILSSRSSNTALALSNQLRLKIALAVSENFEVQIPRVRPDRLFRIAVAGIVGKGLAVLGITKIIFKLGLKGFFGGSVEPDV